MVPQAILPFLLLSRLEKGQQTAFLRGVLPSVFPVPDAQRLMFTTLMVQDQVKQQARTDKNLVKEAVEAGEFRTPADLDRFPTLRKTFDGLSEADQAEIFLSSTPTGATTHRGDRFHADGPPEAAAGGKAPRARTPEHAVPAGEDR